MIRGEAKPQVTARDGLANLRVTEALAEAVRTGKTLYLGLNHREDSGRAQRPQPQSSRSARAGDLRRRNPAHMEKICLDEGTQLWIAIACWECNHEGQRNNWIHEAGRE